MKSLSCNEECLRQHARKALEETAGIKLAEAALHSLKKCPKDLHHKLFNTRLTVVEKCEDEGLCPPIIVHTLCTYLRKHLNVVGLFRINGSHKRIATLKEKLENSSHEFTDENPHDVANLLTLFFRQLPDVLFPKWFCDAVPPIMNKECKELQLQATHLLCLSLPRAHLHCLIYICRFLWEIAQHSSQNRMTVTCLATVFAPNLFEMSTASDINKKVDVIMKRQTKFVELLVENHQHIGKFPSSSLEESVCIGACVHHSNEEDPKHKRRSFADRMKHSMCGKLLKLNSHNSSIQQTDVSVYTKVGMKRTAELEEPCPAKRRSLQGSALDPQEVDSHQTQPKPIVPEVVVTTFQVQETMHKPHINFSGDPSTMKLATKQQRHDSGSTSCFHSIKPASKPKTRRSFHNLRKRKNCDEVIVRYPVNSGGDSTGQKLALHTSISHSDLNSKRKKDKNFLSKLKSPFMSPATRRRAVRKNRHKGNPTQEHQTSVLLQPLKSYDGSSKDLVRTCDVAADASVESLDSNFSITSSEDRTIESSCETLQSSESVDALFHSIDPLSEEAIDDSVAIFDLSLNTLISMNKPASEERLCNESLNASNISSIKGDAELHEIAGGLLETSLPDENSHAVSESNVKELSVESAVNEIATPGDCTSNMQLNDSLNTTSISEKNDIQPHVDVDSLESVEVEVSTQDAEHQSAAKHLSEEANPKETDNSTNEDCRLALESILQQVVDSELRQKKPCVHDKPSLAPKPRNYSSPLKRSRVLSRHSGHYVLEECGIVRGKSGYRRVASSPSRNRQRAVKRVNSPARPAGRNPMSVATRNKLRHGLLRSSEHILPNKVKMLPRTSQQEETSEVAKNQPCVTNDLVRPISAFRSIKTQQRVRQFEARGSQDASTYSRVRTANTRAIKSGRVSEVVEKFNSLSGSKHDCAPSLKLPPLPCKTPQPEEPPISPYTLSKSLSDDLDSPSPPHDDVPPSDVTGGGKNRARKAKSAHKVPVRTPPKPKRAPLVLMNLYTDDDLDNTPVKRATPKQPRSRDPIKPL